MSVSQKRQNSTFNITNNFNRPLGSSSQRLGRTIVRPSESALYICKGIMSSIWLYICHAASILITLSSLAILYGPVNAIELNLALHKQTYQSSTINDLSSSLVVDGKKIAGSQCSMTAEESEPWWSVNLGEIYKVEAVKIYFNQKHTQYVWALSVYIHKEYAGQMYVCQQNIHALVYEFLSVECKGQTGQFITIQLVGMVSELELCEVEVVGEKPFLVHPGEILTRHFCRSKEVPNEVIGNAPARSRIDCAVLCAQTYNCDSFHLKTNDAKRPSCQLKQKNSNALMFDPKEEYNVC